MHIQSLKTLLFYLLSALILGACGQFSVAIQGQSDALVENPQSPLPTESILDPSSLPDTEQDKVEEPADASYLSRIVPFPPSSGTKWIVYDNPAHGFAFQYPDRWQLMEIPGETRELSAPSPWADEILLKNGVYELVIWFNKTSEDRSFLKTVDRGDRIQEGTIIILGESQPIIAIESNGAITAILYGDEHFWAGDLHFSIALVDISDGQESAPEIPTSVKDEVEKILESLVASSVDYTPPQPEPIVDDLPCTTIDPSSQWWVMCIVRDALVSGNLSTLPQWMVNPFALGYWASEWSSRTPESVVEELRNNRLPENRETLTFTYRRDDFPLLYGQPIETMLGPDVLVEQILYSEGWGQDGLGAALLLFGPDSSGEMMLQAIVLSHQHFDK